MSENLKNTIDKRTLGHVIAYVDGYNLFYAVNEWGGQEKPDLVKYDLRKLVCYCLGEIDKETETKDIEETETKDIKEIKFYTAQPIGGKPPLKLEHYKEWTEWQRKKRRVHVIPGFHRCQNGKIKEKQSDVNLAVDMLWDAFPKPGDESEIPYDTAVLISNDTDYCRLVWRCLKLKKQVFVLITECDHSIKDKFCKNTPSSSESYYSKCKKYIDDGMLKFYQINRDDIWKCRDEEYIKWTRKNQSNKNQSKNKKQRQ